MKTAKSLRLVFLFLAAVAARSPLLAAEEPAAVEKQLADAARFLSSDALEGRGAGTKGLEAAADFIAAQFAQSGLKTTALAGTPFQKFSVTTAVSRGANNKLTFTGPSADPHRPERIELKLDADFTPLAVGGSGKFDLPLVFAGYGITSPKDRYDDYAGIDASGKAVVILRRQPQQGNPKSPFAGTNPSHHAPFPRKLSNARDHKAAAVIFCSDAPGVHKGVTEAHKKWQEALDRLAQQHAEFKRTARPALDQIEAQQKRIDELTRQVTAASDRIRAELDPVLPFEGAGRDLSGKAIPVVYCRRSLVDRIVRAATKTDLAAIERQIDEGPKPHSAVLAGWRAAGEIEVQRTQTDLRNVIAVLEGEGPAADETIVVGAHYDHVGWGRPNVAAGEPKAVRNGADDNASGVAVMLEVARELARRKPAPRRRLVFVAFAAEELGLRGSNHYLSSPPFPVEKTAAMVNLDMVGRLRQNKLSVFGSGTSPCFESLIDAVAARYGFTVTKRPAGTGPSDHAPFNARQIPVLHFFTGVHEDLHKPGDDFEKLNLEGMRRIAGAVTEVVTTLATGAKRPEHVAPAKSPAPKKP